MISYRKLYRFYRTVAEMTVNHDVLGDSAVVYPSKLGPELEKINPRWYFIKSKKQSKKDVE